MCVRKSITSMQKWDLVALGSQVAEGTLGRGALSGPNSGGSPTASFSQPSF